MVRRKPSAQWSGLSVPDSHAASPCFPFHQNDGSLKPVFIAQFQIPIYSFSCANVNVIEKTNALSSYHIPGSTKSAGAENPWCKLRPNSCLTRITSNGFGNQSMNAAHAPCKCIVILVSSTRYLTDALVDRSLSLWPTPPGVSWQEV